MLPKLIVDGFEAADLLGKIAFLQKAIDPDTKRHAIKLMNMAFNNIRIVEYAHGRGLISTEEKEATSAASKALINKLTELNLIDKNDYDPPRTESVVLTKTAIRRRHQAALAKQKDHEGLN